MKKVTFKGLTSESLVRSLGAHPYLWAFALCMCIHLLFLSDIAVHITSYSLFAEQIFIQLVGAIVLFKLHDNKKLNFIQFILAELFYALAVFMLFFVYSTVRRKVLFVLFVSVVMVSAFFAYLYKSLKKPEFKEKLWALYIMSMGFTVKMAYSLVTCIGERQHDLTDMTDESGGIVGGHLGYIAYIMDNLSIPSNIDPRTVWQYYHPPLHYIISAIWIYINQAVFGLTGEHAQLTLKSLCLFYSMCIMISCYKLFKFFKLKGRSLIIPLIIVNFSPQFIFFSASMNNDVLSVVFMMGALVKALDWYRDRSMKNILKIALCIGLGMMSKMSAALIAPPVALLFLVAFIKNIKKEWKPLIGQFACFGLVCIPLGLWFGIRNYIKWGVPLNYVQELPFPPEETAYFCGDHTVRERLLDFSPYQYSFKNIYFLSDSLESYVEFNPTIAIFKGSVFNEYLNRLSFGADKIFNVIAFVLFWVNVVIALFAFKCMIKELFRKTPEHGSFFEKAFPVCFYWVLLVSFYVFAFRYPLSFTMNFRYISQVVPIGALFIGLYLTRSVCPADAPEREQRKIKAINTSISVLVVSYALMSCVLQIANTCPHKPK